ncbi:hypothetical protein HDU98_001198 [Podochytrium sp. JEL0797]|nr:hypothetical protein HDU98_001198 [Podochytrium sp. JEL0797]
MDTLEPTPAQVARTARCQVCASLFVFGKDCRLTIANKPSQPRKSTTTIPPAKPTIRKRKLIIAPTFANALNSVHLCCSVCQALHILPATNKNDRDTVLLSTARSQRQIQRRAKKAAAAANQPTKLPVSAPTVDPPLVTATKIEAKLPESKTRLPESKPSVPKPVANTPKPWNKPTPASSAPTTQRGVSKTASKLADSKSSKLKKLIKKSKTPENSDSLTPGAFNMNDFLL